MVLKYYADMNDEPVTDTLIQDIIKTENRLMAFSHSSWKDFHTLAEVQKQTLYFIKAGQLTMAHMFQEQFLNQKHNVSTMHHALLECI